jgi:hypothetical protein
VSHNLIKTVLVFSWLGMILSTALHLFAYLNLLFLDMDSKPLLYLLLPLIAGLPVTYMPAVYRDMNLTDAWHNRKYRWGRRRGGTLKEIARITLSDSPEWMQATAYQAIYVALGYSMLLLLGIITGALLGYESMVPKLVLVGATGLLASFYYFAAAIHTSALKAGQ